MIDPRILKIAKNILIKNMNLKQNEKLVVVTDPPTMEVANMFFESAFSLDFQVDPILVLMKPRDFRGEEPSVLVSEAMMNSDVCLLITNYSISHTEARMKATERGARIASMGSITMDMFLGPLNADYGKISRMVSRISEILRDAVSLRITTPIGTDLMMSLKDRKPGGPDDGLYTEPGRWGNLPAGEAFIAPVEESVNGRLVVDGSIANVGLLHEKVVIDIKDGRITEIEGGAQAKIFEEFLKELDDPNAMVVAELGIGVNERARITGRIIEDEKKLGTAHVGFGMNVDFGGKNLSKTHNDCVFLHPTIEIDGEILMENGKLMIEFT